LSCQGDLESYLIEIAHSPTLYSFLLLSYQGDLDSCLIEIAHSLTLYSFLLLSCQGDLDSYLIEITRDIFGVKDGAAGGGGGDATKDDYVVDKVLDTAGQKGTGLVVRVFL
jgi:hypothetical protein